MKLKNYNLNYNQDLRTDFEVGNPSAVLDGDLDGFIEAGIKWRKGRE